MFFRHPNLLQHLKIPPGPAGIGIEGCDRQMSTIWGLLFKIHNEHRLLYNTAIHKYIFNKKILRLFLKLCSMQKNTMLHIRFDNPNKQEKARWALSNSTVQDAANRLKLQTICWARSLNAHPAIARSNFPCPKLLQSPMHNPRPFLRRRQRIHHNLI